MNKLVTCNSCSVCHEPVEYQNSYQTRQGFAIDCSNIEADASTDGCYVIDHGSDGPTTSTGTTVGSANGGKAGSKFFPGFRTKYSETSGASFSYTAMATTTIMMGVVPAVAAML